MLSKIGKTWMENKKWGSLNINSETLIGPNFLEQVTRIEDDTIKETLFEFLLSTGKKDPREKFDFNCTNVHSF